MMISKLEIISFRGLSNVSIDLKNVNYLVSENNVGKTRILEAVKAFYDCDKGVEIKITYNVKDSELKHLKDEICEDLTFNFVIELKDRKYFINSKNITSKIKSQNLLGRVIYIPSVSDHKIEQDPSKTNHLKDLFDDILGNENLTEDIDVLNEAYTKFCDSFNQKSKDVFENIKKNISLDNFDVDISAQKMDSTSIRKNAFDLKIKENGVSKDLLDLGTGVQRNIINAILCSNYDDSFKIYLYDEPEAFLNPTAQKELINKLLTDSDSRDSQFVFATHSPYIISNRRCDIFKCIIRLKKINSDNIKVFQFKEDIFKTEIQNFNDLFHESYKYKLCDDISKGFLKFWDGNRIAALFESKILICEGPTEELFFDLVVQDNINIPLVVSLGKFNMPYYIILFKKIFNIECVVMFDKDSEKNVNHKVINDWLKDNSDDCLILDKDFESELNYKCNLSDKSGAYLERHLNGSLIDTEKNLLGKIIEIWN